MEMQPAQILELARLIANSRFQLSIDEMAGRNDSCSYVSEEFGLRNGLEALRGQSSRGLHRYVSRSAYSH